MRKEHGPSFNLTVIKALLCLRTDLDKQQKTLVLKECKDILSEYKNEKAISSSGIFNSVNTSEAIKEFNDEMKDPEEEKAKGKGKGKNVVKVEEAEEVEEDEEEFNFDDFLKEGGINADELIEKPTDETNAAKQNKSNNKDSKEEKKIVGREDMNGWLYKSNDDVKQDKAIFDHVLNTVTDTFHSVVDNINKTRTKRFFRIKKDHLYWYTKMDSNKAQNEIDIRKIEQVEINQDNNKMILILYKNKLYKLEGDSRDYVEEWYKSIALVRSKTDEYLNLDRYVDSNVFSKVTGKSIFRDFEAILEEHFKAIEEQKQREQAEIDRKAKEAREEQERLNREQELAQEAKDKKIKKTKNEQKEMFNSGDLEKSKDSIQNKQQKFAEKEVRLNDEESEYDIDGNLNVELSKIRSTAIVERKDSNMDNSDMSSLKLYRTNTESELTKYKDDNKANNKELMQVYEKYNNIKQDNMFDIIQRHESASSDSSGKGSPGKADKRSAKKKDNNGIDKSNPQNDTQGYSSSNMNNLNIKKGNTDQKKTPNQPKSIFGCFTCFRK